ncbi:MAG TPA: HU family DNA-binding protein [Bacillota bacterium]|jgi:DNA-binding protein HU-beta|nr:HU family DNA-binding protein [Bacillota bacterium]HOI38384.1 HU family DNA-binding protein [Bacillota bacterium]HPU76602.1 HU family DNA-binding protein [Bacillota bacterium]
MTKSDLVDSVAAKAGMTKKDSTRAVDAVFDTIKEQLKAGDKVQLVGFGSFEVKQREARVGRNPKTMDEIRIPARRVPVFRPGKELKESVM